MVLITRTTSTDASTFCWSLRKEPDLHRHLCELLSRLGFRDKDILQVDFSMDAVRDEVVLLRNRRFLVLLVVTPGTVHLLLHDERGQPIRTSLVHGSL